MQVHRSGGVHLLLQLSEAFFQLVHLIKAFVRSLFQFQRNGFSCLHFSLHVFAEVFDLINHHGELGGDFANTLWLIVSRFFLVHINPLENFWERKLAQLLAHRRNSRFGFAVFAPGLTPVKQIGQSAGGDRGGLTFRETCLSQELLKFG